MGNSRFKFRAWNKELKSFLIHNEEDKTFDLNVFNSVLKNPKYLIMQCTGLKDKNGKLIYEGDIVKWGVNKFVVVWQKRLFAIKKDISKKPIDFSLTSFEGDEFEVIGNIYTDAHLLEEFKNENK